MSLTSHLDNLKSPVRQFFDEHFPHVRDIQMEARPTIVNFMPATILPSAELPYGTIGTALDYRLRYYFTITKCHDLVAFKGAARRSEHPNHEMGLWQDCLRLMGRLPEGQIVPSNDDPEYTESLFFVHLYQKLEELQPVRRRLDCESEITLCRLCVILAFYEQIFRMGSVQKSPLSRMTEDTLAQLLAMPPAHWLDDLCTLSWSFHESFPDLLEAEYIELNPKFKGSADVGGADADLILDNCLIDIKTTIKPELTKAWLYQLLGYVLLDYEDKYKIESVAILFSRQGFMLQWELERLMRILCGGAAPDLEKLRDEFQKMIEAERKRQLHAFHQEKHDKRMKEKSDNPTPVWPPKKTI